MSARDDLDRFDEQWQMFLYESERWFDVHRSGGGKVITPAMPSPVELHDALMPLFRRKHQEVRAELIAAAKKEARRTLEELE